MRIDKASPQELQDLLSQSEARYAEHQAAKLSLNLTRGKPGPEQLALSDDLDGNLQGQYQSPDGVDLRNYGGLDGLAQAKALFAPILDVQTDEIFVGGNSSLTLMYLSMLFCHRMGLSGPGSAWSEQHSKVRVLCPVPGYDRHFKVCSHLGIEMVPVPMTEQGPDMEKVESLLRQDASICGIWCVPRFSNPTGVVYSESTVERMAKLATLTHPHFRIFWDNAYALHTLHESAPPLASLMAAAKKAGTQDSVLMFGSTSKISFAGAGVAFMGCSAPNLAALKTHFGMTMIGPDKINQQRHIQKFGDLKGLQAHMKKHAALLAPRFDAVLSRLESHFGDSDMGQWTRPEGGYFISFDTRPGLAREVVRLAQEAGVKLTPAGATFPNGEDPEDRNIRIAPSYPSVEEIAQATEVFCTCVTLASARQALQQ